MDSSLLFRKMIVYKPNIHFDLSEKSNASHVLRGFSV